MQSTTLRERERERERERQRETERDRDRDRDRDRQTDRQTETERQTERQENKNRDRDSQRDTDKETQRQTDRQKKILDIYEWLRVNVFVRTQQSGKLCHIKRLYSLTFCFDPNRSGQRLLPALHDDGGSPGTLSTPY